MLLGLLGSVVGSIASLLVYPVTLLLLYKIYQRVWSIPLVSRTPSSCYVLVTGCGSGFGRETAKRLDSLGCHVFAGCRTEHGLKELDKETSERCRVFVMDVTNAESIQNALELVQSSIPKGQGLWGLVNNAGIAGSRLGSPEWSDVSDFHEVFDVNLYGYVRVIQAFLPLVKQAEGRIIMMSSVSGRLAYPFAAPYAASKFATEAYGDGLRRSLKPYNCRVILIEPGVYRTNMIMDSRLVEAVNKGWESIPLEERKELGEQYYNDLTKFLTDSFRINFFNRLSTVAETVEQALLCKYPKARYLEGNDAKYLFLPVTYLPEWLSDWLMCKIGGQPIPPQMKIKNKSKAL